MSAPYRCGAFRHAVRGSNVVSVHLRVWSRDDFDDLVMRVKGDFQVLLLGHVGMKINDAILLPTSNI